MSNLKNASLILKTTDLFNTIGPATVYGYFSTTTKFIVTALEGTVPSSAILLDNTNTPLSTVTPSTNLNKNSYGYLTLATAVTNATASHATYNFSSIGNILKLTAITTQEANITRTLLSLSNDNTDVAIGQHITGVGVSDNTVIISGSGKYWIINNSLPRLSAIIVSFFDFPTDINIADGVSGTGYTDGTCITEGPLFDADGIYYITNTSQTVSADDLEFYETDDYFIEHNSLIDATYSYSNGTCDKYRTTMTWNSINLRTLLGDMYNDYDLFNLCLSSIATSKPTASISTDADNLNVIVKVSGLPFINQTYDVAHGHNKTDATVCAFQFNASDPKIEFYYDNVMTFGKNQEQCNITISYERIIDGKSPSYTAVLPPKTASVVSPFPHCVFNFDIFGVEKYSKNGNRI